MDDVVSITVFPLGLSPLILYYVTQDIRYVVMFLYVSSIASITEIIKRTIVRYSDIPIWKRPSGAYNCGAFNNGGNSAYAPGFPSGHVALATFLACAYGRSSNNMLIQVIGIGYIGAVSQSRMKKRCHSMLQIIGGACVGLIAYILFDTQTNFYHRYGQ